MRAYDPTHSSSVTDFIWTHTHIYTHIGMYINKNRKTLYENVLSCGIKKKRQF